MRPQAEEQDERKEHTRNPQDQLIGLEQRRDIRESKREIGHDAEGALRQQPACPCQKAAHHRIGDKAHQPTQLQQAQRQQKDPGQQCGDGDSHQHRHKSIFPGSRECADQHGSDHRQND